MTSSTHVVKSWPQFFQQIIQGRRAHELRRDDRGYQVGDFLHLCEWDPESQDYTGAAAMFEITSITSDAQTCAVSGEGLSPGFCILSIRWVP